MRKGPRQKLEGWGCDWCSKRARRFVRWRAGVGRFIKRRLARKRRQEAKWQNT